MREYAETAERADPIAAVLRDRIVHDALATRGAAPPGPEPSTDRTQCQPDETDIGIFTHLLLHRSEWSAEDYFVSLLNEGAPVTTLFTELLSGAARLLGEQWLKDECSFVDVTLGLTVLHRLLHRYGGQLDLEVSPITEDRAIMITPIAGEDHIFAASLLLEFFRSARWRVFSGVGERREAIVRSAEKKRVDVVAISVSAAERLEDCRRLVGDLRDRSSNADTRILVGGPPFAADPQAYRSVGADAVAADPITALDVAATITSDSTGKVS